MEEGQRWESQEKSGGGRGHRPHSCLPSGEQRGSLQLLVASSKVSHPTFPKPAFLSDDNTSLSLVANRLLNLLVRYNVIVNLLYVGCISKLL